MKNLNRYIEHTALHAAVDEQGIQTVLDQAKKYNFRGVCLPPFWVKKAKRELSDLDIQLVTVVGFPLGYSMTQTKVFETRQAIKDGVDELDVVWSITGFKSRMNWPKIELAQLAKVCHDEEKLLKVIIETALLKEEELSEACHICVDAGVDFVKTSTGFAEKGAQIKTIKRLRNILPSQVGIKASGGIKSLEQAEAMVAAGADRIGSSSGHLIMEAWLDKNP
ncbi:deoxyribose-phosphate aldolase [Cyclobacterium marinum]|uniref:Deoxyribose-phosphate aldolase n=1 Tax=Cyclobacterium marinum (strain ATCC 25205 / DSM 745 / LMG 13164 / NCIMB 1802) TaxID=880070 RepID=G0IUU1_CYCMS|nr:deoxyribose-phosphate aldolase [Cyclobacterium marinum]AEL25483.1 Deoxyribose-phosphate aldolase [Cyclobacterium marinum DSM 745]MBI0400921.1 deoxyribose-phosphate aldolase [Cyclobacterium marinum]